MSEATSTAITSFIPSGQPKGRRGRHLGDEILLCLYLGYTSDLSDSEVARAAGVTNTTVRVVADRRGWSKNPPLLPDGETWRNMTFAPEHMVSSLGDVWRKESVRGHRAGMLRPTINRCGYLAVSIRINGVIKTRNVHTLVANAFLGPMQHGMNVNHISGVKTDNRIRNLEYVTPRENCRHAALLGLRDACRGSRVSGAKLNERLVLEIKAMLAAGQTPTEIAPKYGVSRDTISGIRHGKWWGYVK